MSINDWERISEPHDSSDIVCIEKRVLIVTPTFNEADNLPTFLKNVLRVAPYAHVLIVDDASPDGTGKVADSLAYRDRRVFVLHRPAKLGLGTAYRQGFRWGLARGYDLFFEMDADLSHDPNQIPRFLDNLRKGVDLVVGSRNTKGGGVEGWGLGRHVLSKGGSLYSRLILGVPVSDLTTGYKAYTRQALEKICINTLQSNGYAFQIETTYRALEQGLAVIEIPIVFVDRRVGHSKMDWRVFLEAIKAPWKLRFSRIR